MPRPWRPTRRCATSCGATRVKATGRCWSTWPESGIETPTAEDLARLDRKRKGKKLSNEDWVSKSDPEAKIAKMKDGTTHLAYKPEHAVDLDVPVVAAELGRRGRHDDASQNVGDGQGEPRALTRRRRQRTRPNGDRQRLSTGGLEGLGQRPVEDGSPSPSRRASRAGAAITNPDPARGLAKEAFKLRAEIVERSFAQIAAACAGWLRGRENVHKRYLLHVAGHIVAALDRRRHRPREAVAGGYWRYFRAAHAHRGHAGRTGGLAKRPDGFRFLI